MAQAYDEYGNPIDEQPQQNPAAAWENAAGEINRWKDQNAAGSNINWEAARSAFDQSGGDLNKVYNLKNQWMSAAPQAQAKQPFDYEGFRTGWLTAGFGSKTSPEQLAQHAAKWGVTIKNGQHAYDPQGNYLGDMIGDVGGRNTLQFLRGPAGHATAAKLSGKKPAAPKGKAPKVVNSHGPGSGAPPTAPGGPAAPPVAPPPPPPPPTDPGGSVAPVQDPRLTALYEQLLARSKQGSMVDRNDPAVRQQADAYAAQEERARRNYLSDLAESEGPNTNLRGE